jgi:hypothetical protein
VYLTLIGGIIFLLREAHNVRRERRLMAGLCPGDKMSCIGKYPRNVICLTETLIHALYWILGAIVHVSCNHLFAKFETSLQPRFIFYMNTIFWIILLDLPLLRWTILLGMKEIPFVKETPRITKFYVLKPCIEPRRPSFRELKTGVSTGEDILTPEARMKNQPKQFASNDFGIQIVESDGENEEFSKKEFLISKTLVPVNEGKGKTANKEANEVKGKHSQVMFVGEYSRDNKFRSDPFKSDGTSGQLCPVDD